MKKYLILTKNGSVMIEAENMKMNNSVEYEIENFNDIIEYRKYLLRLKIDTIEKRKLLRRFDAGIGNMLDTKFPYTAITEIPIKFTYLEEKAAPNMSNT